MDIFQYIFFSETFISFKNDHNDCTWSSNDSKENLPSQETQENKWSQRLSKVYLEEESILCN